MTSQMRGDLAAHRAATQQLHEQVTALAQQVAGVSEALTEQRERLLLGLRMVRDDDAGARRNLLTLRQSTDYRAAFDEAEPLVSIVIPTYNNWPQLRERSLPSVLAQSYQNWECIIVGDCAPEETREVIDSFDDDRISVYEPSLQRAIPGQRQGSVDDQRHTAVERRGRVVEGEVDRGSCRR